MTPYALLPGQEMNPKILTVLKLKIIFTYWQNITAYWYDLFMKSNSNKEMNHKL
jgi:hypothetical protein